MNKCIVPLIAVVLCHALSSAETASNLAVWCVNETVKVPVDSKPPEKNSVWDGASRTVRLGSARNEYVAFQIAIGASANEIKGITVEPSALNGPNGSEIPVGNIELFLEHYLEVKLTTRVNATTLTPYCTAGWHPAQIVPFNAKKFGAPFDVPVGTNKVVWVDIYVPENAAKGEYTGTFKVTGGDGPHEIHVTLKIWDFTLPHETHFKTWLYTGPENIRWAHHVTADTHSTEVKTLLDKYYQMAHQHRMNIHPLISGTVEEIQQNVKYYNGQAFTERVGKGVGQNVLSFQPERKDEAAVKDAVKKQMQFCEREKITSTIINYVWDEPHSDEDFSTSKKLCKWIHEASDGKWQTMIATPQFQKYDPGDVNIYTETTASDIPKVIARGEAVWMVNGYYAAGPFTDSPGFGGRSIPWMAWRMNITGWQFWDCCYWFDRQCLRHREGRRWVANMTAKQIEANPEKYMTDIWNDPMTFDETRKQGYPASDALRYNGNGVLYYPGYAVGIDGPIASFALKSLRRGAQEYEYLWLLHQSGRDAEIDKIVRSVCLEPSKFEMDPEKWDEARQKLAALLENGR